MRIDHYVGESVEVELDFDGEKLSVTWAPRSYTVRMQEQIEAQPTTGTVEALAKLVRKWNLQDSKGKVVPLTLEALKDVPYPLLVDVMGKLVESLRPPAPSSTTSSFG